MSLQETEMKLAFFFFFTVSTLLGAHHARHLHDGCIYKSFNGRPPVKTAEVIQMVTGEEESQGQTVDVGNKLEGLSSPKGALPEGQTNYGRDNPKAPPPPKVAPSRGQTTYGGDNPNSNGRDHLNAQPSPIGAPDEGEAVYGVDNPKSPPSPSLKPDSSVDRKTYGRDDPTTPPTPDANDPHNQGMYGGSSFADSTSTLDGRRSRIPVRAPAFTSFLIKKVDDQLHTFGSHWLLSYITSLEYLMIGTDVECN